MNKIIKAIFASSLALSCGGVAISNVSCGHKNATPVKGTFLYFQTASANDHHNIIKKHPSFKYSDYLGSIGISISETNNFNDNYIRHIGSKLNANGILKNDVSGVFEEPFNTDINNTVAMVFLKGESGQSLRDVYDNSKIIFNSWDNQSYSINNWADKDNSPNYYMNQFSDNLKTDQGSLMKIFGSNNDDTKGLRYQGTSEFEINNLIGVSHLEHVSKKKLFNSKANDSLFPIMTNYTLVITAKDNDSDIVIIKSDFSFQKGDKIPTSKNITDELFSHTEISSALTVTDVKLELTNFLELPSLDKSTTFKQVWKKYVWYYNKAGKQTRMINPKSITIGNIGDKGEISVAVVDPTGRTSLNLITRTTISTGFGSTPHPKDNDTKKSYARFINANYDFSDADTWDDSNLALAMMSVFHLKEITQ